MRRPSIFDDITLDQVTIGEVLAALSQALDLTEGQPRGHCLRACQIGMKIGEAAGITGDELADLYYAILLKDLGCSSNAARICELYLADDQAFKQGFKTMGASTRQALAFVLRHTGADEGLATRIKTVADVLRNREEILTDIFQTRCQQGADIATMMGFSPMVADAIESLDEHWDGTGRPARRKGQAIPRSSQIALLAQVVDVFGVAHGAEAAKREIAGRSGAWFDPELVALALPLIDDAFWADGDPNRIEAQVMSLAPAQDAWVMTEDILDEMVAGFARVIDAKSPFTHGHSARVAMYTDLICARLDVSDQARRWMRRAALLHDMGKLGISNRLLDKPEKLTNEEFETIKTHPVLGEEILSRISVFLPLSQVAGAHHERLDGKGYPGLREAGTLSWEMRALSVADVFDALSADRPYRAALPLPKVWDIMDGMVGEALDREYLDILKAALADMPALEFATG